MAEDETSKEGTVIEPTAPSVVFDVEKHVPQDLRGEKYWESFKGKPIEEVLKSGYETKKMVGNAIQLPKDDDPEGWNKIYDKLGRPKEPKEYAFENKIDGLEYDEAILESYKQSAHKRGLTAAQFKGMMEDYNELLYTQTDKLQKEDLATRNAVDLEMREKYGNNYDFATAIGKRAIRELIGDEDAAKMIEEVMIRNPKVFTAMVKEGERMRSHGTIDGVTPFGFGGIDPAGAVDEINKVRNDPSHPYHDPTKPGHKEAFQKMQNLYKVAYPDV